jgi:hypothetical protein
MKNRENLEAVISSHCIHCVDWHLQKLSQLTQSVFRLSYCLLPRGHAYLTRSCCQELPGSKYSKHT